MRSCNFLRLIYNKVTSRSYGYFFKFLYFNFLRNWLFQLIEKLQNLVKKTQGILGVKHLPLHLLIHEKRKKIFKQNFSQSIVSNRTLTMECIHLFKYRCNTHPYAPKAFLCPKLIFLHQNLYYLEFVQHANLGK
jgi:hypothetical protein